jgi:hypothetical protein
MSQTDGDAHGWVRKALNPAPGPTFAAIVIVIGVAREEGDERGVVVFCPSWTNQIGWEPVLQPL